MKGLLCRGFVTVLLVAALSACGFQLAGRQALPPQLKSVYIDVVNPYGVDVPPLQRALTQRIVSSGGSVASSLQHAHSVLRLSHLSISRETVAIGPDGRALEYRLITTVEYTLAVSGRPVLPPETQSVSNDYSFSANQILAKEEEQSRLEAYTQDELAQLILMRLKAELSHLPTPAAATSAAG